MRISAKGRVTIPAAIRDRLQLVAGLEVEFEVHGDVLLLRKARPSTLSGQAIVDHLRGRATTKMATDEILALTRGD